MRPELEIPVEEKDTFKEVINDIIDIERRLAANSALRRNRNTDYLKTEELSNNKNDKTGLHKFITKQFITHLLVRV